MNAAATIAIAVVALVVLGAVVALTAARRTDVRGAGALSRETVTRDMRSATAPALDEAPTGKEVERAARTEQSRALVPAAPAEMAPWVPPDPEALGVNRRQFFNRAYVTLMSAGLGGFGVAVIGFLWPRPTGGFGGKVNLGKLEDLKAGIIQNNGFLYMPEARTWVTAYPADALPKARTAYASQPTVLAAMETGIVTLYQKCPHLGCRVPECKSSQWFECPCHGSQYNRIGEKKAGPAPRGMDRFGATVSATGDVVVDTSVPLNGPPIGTNTSGQEAEGPHCITGGEGKH